MKPLRILLLTLSVAALAFSANGVINHSVVEEDCDEDQQHTVNDAEFSKGARIRLASQARDLNTNPLREQYEKLKHKADQFVSSSGTNLQDLGVDSYGNFKAGSQFGSASYHSAGGTNGVQTANSFFNNDGSLLHTVEGLKAHGQGVQFTATGDISPLKNYQDGQVISQNNGGYGSVYEKHASSHSEHSSNSNTAIPIHYTPYEKHHQSTSVKVEESIKRRNHTDYLEPELISQKINTVVHPLNYAYGAQSAGSFSQASKTHANYDNSNSGYGLYQVPMTVIPVLGSNDANYLSETKSQSLSKTLVSSHDSTQGAVEAKPIKIQNARPTPSGVDQMWHKLVQGQTSYSGDRVVEQTSYGTTAAENEDSPYIRPIALTAQNSQSAGKSESHQSSSSSSASSYHSNHQSGFGSSSGSHASYSQGQTNGGRVATNTQVGDPNAPQNSGYAITGENKGFYAKSVELANLLSATIAPMEEPQNQGLQQNVQQSSAGSHYDARQTGSSGYQNNYEKHHSSSSQFEKTQSQNLGGQQSYSGVPVVNEPYRGSERYAGGAGSSYDWSTSGSGYGQYTQHRGNLRPVSSYGAHESGYNGGSRTSSSQSWQSSQGAQSSSGTGGVYCGECVENVGQIRYEHGTPVKNSYGLASQFASSSSNINGQKSESKSASVTVNDNGKVDTYSRHNK